MEQLLRVARRILAINGKQLIKSNASNHGAGRNCTGVQRKSEKRRYMLSLCLSLSCQVPTDRDLTAELLKRFHFKTQKHILKLSLCRRFAKPKAKPLQNVAVSKFS